MNPSPAVRDWARRLLAYDGVASPPARPVELATLRVYERLRRQLSAPVGVDGFQTLASRALMLAKSEAPRLSSIQIRADGSLEGLGELGAQPETDGDGEVGIVLIAQLLGLILTFLGETTTRRLIEDLRLQAAVATEPAATGLEAKTSGAASSGVAGSGTNQGFESILREVDRLRYASETLEALAGQHPDMEAGLVTVAGNIRSIATILDVFVLVRGISEESQEEVNQKPITGYLM